MGFINNANSIIGDNMRYVQQLKANPQALQQNSPATAFPGADASMSGMMPMLMMMMFQMMSQMMAGQQGQPGQQPGYPPFPDPNMGYLGGYPGGSYPGGGYPGGMPFPPPPNAPAPPSNQEQWIQQNPAYLFLTAHLGGGSSVPGTPGGMPTIATPDFSTNSSLANAMNTLLANNTDVNLHALGTHILSGNTNGQTPAALKAQVQNELIQQGKNTPEIEAFGLLFDGMQNNNNLEVAKVQAAANPSDANNDQVTRLTQNRQMLAGQWSDLQSEATIASTKPGTGTTTGTNLTDSVRDALASGQFTPQQLGQSLKYLLDNAPSDSLGELGSLIGSLTKSGDLNILPFLHSKYLDKLAPARQMALLNAVESAGLTLDDGKPNSRFAGFLLENLSRPGTSSTQNFLQQFLQNEWLDHGGDSTSAEGKALANVMSLSGLQGTVGQPLVLTQ